MRFNKQELITLAALPSNKFEKEGILNIIEKQEGFFTKREGDNSFKVQKITRRKTLSCIGGIGKVSFPRWCKLRGNLLFYLKDQDPFSPPLGLIVLENCRPVIRSESRDIDGYSFFIEFRDGLSQRIATNTEIERTDWINAIQMASYGQLNKQLKYLRDQIEKKLGYSGEGSQEPAVTQMNKPDAEIDITEIPLCESAVSCDNLLCDGHGRPPNPSIDVQIQNTTNNGCGGWLKYGQTELIDRCANPQFLCTIVFRASDGLSSSSLIRFTVYDVREKVSRTAIPIGYAEISLGVIQDTSRIRLPLRSVQGNAGFITIASWAPDQDKKTPRSPAKIVENQNLGHRRSQSLPPKLGVKLFVPPQAKLPFVFANPSLHTYRLHSGLGGDISVQEVMMESRLCYVVPQQLLSIWILREKELLQEISGMGELGGEWRNKQMDLLDKHLKLLKDYSQAKQNLLQYNNNNVDKFFKPSANKTDESLEFVPVNLHLQRMWAHNDTLKRSGVLDILTSGAFTRHAGKSKTGGLIKLLQQNKDSPSKLDPNGCKVQAANDVVQAIKQLRKEIVEIMSQLLCLAKAKNPKGMMPLCNEMVTKTRTLLNLWEPNLVEEAFAFIEQHRILEEPDNTIMPMSPFRKITQQLGALDLKSPDLEDFATPMGAPPDLWPIRNSLSPNRTSNLRMKSPSATDINTISSIQQSVQIYNNQSRGHHHNGGSTSRATNISHSLPTTVPNFQNKSTPTSTPNRKNEPSMKFSETHFDVSGEISTSESQPQSLVFNDNDGDAYIGDNHNNSMPSADSTASSNTLRDSDEVSNQLAESKNEILYQSADFDESGYIPMNCSIVLGHNGAFLDTKVMSSSPSANYYRPTEEPEPLDLTQLNIEASVMCLVSKVKFLCGRCGSPAVRLRQPRNSIKRGFNNMPPDVVTSQPMSHASNSAMSSMSQSMTESSQQPESVGSNVSQSESLILNAGNVLSGAESGSSVSMSLKSNGCMSGKDLNLALTQAVGEVTRKVKKGNKFTDGLDLSMTTDWASELRPSMRKLRHAMDGLLKTARLIHSVQRLQQDMKKISTNLAIMYRRDVCFSQAFTALVSGIMNKLWGSTITENYIEILSHLGPLAYFEGLLSLYGGETDMWGDMCIAIEDLSAVNFTLVRSDIQRETKNLPIPRIVGSRHSLTVLLPVPENVYSIVPTKEAVTFKVTPVFFNIGINERATLSETLGYTREQHRSNWDNYDRLKSYHIRYKKLNLVTPDTPSKNEQNVSVQTVTDYLNAMEESLRANTSKNVKVLHLAEDICRAMNGLRFTSCKSGKDRTGMAVTLEQCRILQQEFHLPANSVPNVLNTMRSEGTRIDNVVKNIELRKYAFNLPQVVSLPVQYRPPAGSYGKAQT